ncbi:protein SPMIP2 [Discoglossus pictus]
MLQKRHARPSTALPSCQHLPRSTGQRMLYTGPDYVGDYRTKLPDFTRYIGEVTPSAESTSEVAYICRAAPGTPPPLYKDLYVGGIGWGVAQFSFLNRRQLISDYQIKLGEFRKDCEERRTHNYQNPWSPPLHILDAQGYGARGSLAWHIDRYDGYGYGKGYWASRLNQGYVRRSMPAYLQEDYGKMN